MAIVQELYVPSWRNLPVYCLTIKYKLSVVYTFELLCLICFENLHLCVFEFSRSSVFRVSVFFSLRYEFTRA